MLFGVVLFVGSRALLSAGYSLIARYVMHGIFLVVVLESGDLWIAAVEECPA